VEPGSSDAQDIVEMLSSSGFSATLTPNTVGSPVEWMDTTPPEELGLPTMQSAFALADFFRPRLGAQTDNEPRGFGGTSASINQALTEALSPFER
jgi:hypothetical protein